MNETWDTADHCLAAYLHTVTYEQARLDYAPTTAIEIRMLSKEADR
jgi:hypothetical protein